MCAAFVRCREYFRTVCDQLKPQSLDLAARDAESIFEHVLRIPRIELYTETNRTISPEERSLIDALVARRSAGTPLAYVLGYTWFYGRKFFVSPNVLIPRPDTEILIETILEHETSSNARFLDFGTGSGILAETLTAERAGWRVFACDISISAVRIAAKNCSGRVHLFVSDGFLTVKPSARFDCIVTNPPYIALQDMQSLDASVICHEPYHALFGGHDGLDFYRILAKCGKTLLLPEGKIYCEIGADQGDAVMEIFRQAQWQNMTIFQDLAARPRVFMATSSMR